MMKLFRRLFGRAESACPLYIKQAECIQSAAACLTQMMQTTDIDEWYVLEHQIKSYEVQADGLLTEIFESLYDSLLTPAARSDMQTIAMAIDDFLDKINSSAKSIILYYPKRIDAQIEDLAGYIKGSAGALVSLVRYFDNLTKNFKSISAQCDRIAQFEHEADETYEDYVGYIFQNEHDAIELMKYKNMAEVLEETSDTAKRISDTIRMILLKHTNN